MELFVNQVLAGISTGAIYACMALAVVMIYQAIDHLNFAQGEMAMFSTFISWQVVMSNSSATSASMMCHESAGSPRTGLTVGMPQPSSALRYSAAAPTANVGILSRKKLRPWSW